MDFISEVLDQVGKQRKQNAENNCINHRDLDPRPATRYVFNRKYRKDGTTEIPHGTFATGNVCDECKAVWDEQGYDAYNAFSRELLFKRYPFLRRD